MRAGWKSSATRTPGTGTAKHMSLAGCMSCPMHAKESGQLMPSCAARRLSRGQVMAWPRLQTPQGSLSLCFATQDEAVILAASEAQTSPSSGGLLRE